MKKSLFLLLLPACILTACNHHCLGEQAAREFLTETLRDSTAVQGPSDTLVKDKKMAIALAETYWFSVFGKSRVKKERPYEAYLIDGYWVIFSTSDQSESFGGNSEIIINARNGKVVRLSHGK